MLLVIGMPFCSRPVHRNWALALSNLQLPLNSTYAKAPTIGLEIDAARTQLAKLAIEKGAKYLYFMDDDTAPPPNIFTRLIRVLESDPHFMVAGGIYFSREKQPQPVVFAQEGMGPTWDWTMYEVFECSSIGTGAMMVKTEVFEKIPEPWFYTDKENFITDDIYFCRKVREAGYKIAADGGSICLHFDAIKDKVYTMGQNDPPVQRWRKYIQENPDVNHYLGSYILGQEPPKAEHGGEIYRPQP